MRACLSLIRGISSFVEHSLPFAGMFGLDSDESERSCVRYVYRDPLRALGRLIGLRLITAYIIPSITFLNI